MLSTSLRYFVAVARSGSMREAAEQLRIAQSAVSRQIQKLEEEMRVKLLERNARGVRLTSAGEVLMYHTQEVMQQTARLEADIEAVRGVRRGHVVVRSIESFASSFLPDVLEQFCARYPAVTLDIGVARTPGILESVRSGQCQIGIAFCPPPDPDLVALATRVEPQMVMISPHHPLANLSMVDLAQLRDYPIVGPALNGGSRIIFDAAWHAEKLTCRPMVETNSIHVVASVLRAGRAVAIASVSRAQPYLSAGQILAIPSSSPVLAKGRVDLLVRRNQRLPPAAGALARAMARALATDKGE
jgi:DNA-binding transcriptional LysR family regulator